MPLYRRKGEVSMKEISLSRRAMMLGAAALPMARKAVAQARPTRVVISSANAFNGGINCCAKAMEAIKAGGDTLDAVVAGVNIVELDPLPVRVFLRLVRGLFRSVVGH